MDDPGDRGAGAREDREHVALVADGEVGVAQVAGHRLLPQHGLHPGLHGAVEPARPVAQLGQLRAGALRELARRLDGGLDPRGDPLGVGEGRRERPEPREVDLPRGEDRTGPGGRPGQRRHVAQGERLEHPALGGALERRGGVAGRGDGEGDLRLGEGPGLGEQGQRLPHLVRPVEEGEGGRAGLPARGPAAGGERLEDERPPSSSSVRGWAINAPPPWTARAGRAPRRAPRSGRARRRASDHRPGRRVEPHPGEQPLREQPEPGHPGGEPADAVRCAGGNEREHEQRDGREHRGGHRREHEGGHHPADRLRHVPVEEVRGAEAGGKEGEPVEGQVHGPRREEQHRRSGSLACRHAPVDLRGAGVCHRSPRRGMAG